MIVRVVSDDRMGSRIRHQMTASCIAAAAIFNEYCIVDHALIFSEPSGLLPGTYLIMPKSFPTAHELQGLKPSDYSANRRSFRRHARYQWIHLEKESSS